MSSAQERATGYQQTTQGAAEPGAPGRTADYDRAAAQQQQYDDYGGGAALGGMVLAGTLLVLAGLWGFFVGITGVLKGAFYAPVTNYTFNYSIHAWGWTHLIIGVLVFAVGVCLLLGQSWARYVGVFFAVVDAIANFLFLPYYPLWSIIVIAIDVFIIWALLAVGRRQPA
jgi:hypothetical protein